MKVSKEAIETIKTVTIAVLITGAVAFVGGVKYQIHTQNTIDAAVKSAVSQNVASQSPKK